MSKKWSKEDRNSFENSVVMKEFEKLIISRAQQLERLHEKIANVKEVTKDLQDANQAANNLKNTMQGMGLDSADDGEVESITITPGKGTQVDRSADVDIHEEEGYPDEEEEQIGDDVAFADDNIKIAISIKNIAATYPENL